MIDFTLKSYAHYLKLIKDRFDHILTFNDYFSSPERWKEFCLLRHDVDRLPGNALKMARIENSFGISSSYYFRAKKFIMNKRIMTEISNLGHEIGYHYESLSDAKGNKDDAFEDFKNNLKTMRKIIPVYTIAMHGKPLSPHDSRKMWENSSYKETLHRGLNIKGEVYLDIDYKDIAYITDTGRNWKSNASNIRDHVNSNINLNLTNQAALINFFKSPHPKTIFLTHPERWHDNAIWFGGQLFIDTAVNGVKRFL